MYPLMSGGFAAHSPNSGCGWCSDHTVHYNLLFKSQLAQSKFPFRPFLIQFWSRYTQISVPADERRVLGAQRDELLEVHVQIAPALQAKGARLSTWTNGAKLNLDKRRETFVQLKGRALSPEAFFPNSVSCLRYVYSLLPPCQATYVDIPSCQSNFTLNLYYQLMGRALSPKALTQTVNLST